jgi:hypothetical protein
VIHHRKCSVWKSPANCIRCRSCSSVKGWQLFGGKSVKWARWGGQLTVDRERRWQTVHEEGRPVRDSEKVGWAIIRSIMRRLISGVDFIGGPNRWKTWSPARRASRTARIQWSGSELCEAI